MKGKDKIGDLYWRMYFRSKKQPNVEKAYLRGEIFFLLLALLLIYFFFYFFLICFLLFQLTFTQF